MTNKDAAFLLGACRPNGADNADPEFAEALDQVSRDPALAAWLEDQRRFDTAIAGRLRASPVPADLRSRILAGGRVSKPAPWLTARRLWAIAAMIAVFAGVGVWVSMESRASDNEWKNQALATLSGLLSGQEHFDAKSPDVNTLQQWLRSNGSPSDMGIPASLRNLASVGCKTLSWNGHPMSIICFHGPGGELVHLAMVDQSALASPPPEGHPEFETRDGWRMACWSQDGMAMMLATRAPESQLRVLLGIAFLF
ncbi:MAG: hypothetical protein ABSE62_13870 [Chthoniobacteraceae bacterium]|jgi:hypothetical protein